VEGVDIAELRITSGKLAVDQLVQLAIIKCFGNVITSGGVLDSDSGSNFERDGDRLGFLTSMPCISPHGKVER
jgi:hypothetical protein